MNSVLLYLIMAFLSGSTDGHFPGKIMGPSKGVSCVACRLFCSCPAPCSIVLNVAVTFEQKLTLYFGLVMLHAAYKSLSQIVAIFLIISVAFRHFDNGLSPHFQTVLPVTQNPWRASLKYLKLLLWFMNVMRSLHACTEGITTDYRIFFVRWQMILLYTVPVTLKRFFTL